MLAKKLPRSSSDLPTRPMNPQPLPRFEAAAPQRTHLMLVRTPDPTLRSLAWARRAPDAAFDALALTSMLRLERLNLG